MYYMWMITSLRRSVSTSPTPTSFIIYIGRPMFVHHPPSPASLLDVLDIESMYSATTFTNKIVPPPLHLISLSFSFILFYILKQSTSADSRDVGGQNIQISYMPSLFFILRLQILWPARVFWRYTGAWCQDAHLSFDAALAKRASGILSERHLPGQHFAEDCLTVADVSLSGVLHVVPEHEFF